MEVVKDRNLSWKEYTVIEFRVYVEVVKDRIWSWTQYTVIEYRPYVEVVRDHNLILDRVHSYWIQSLCGSSEGSQFDPGHSTQLLNSESLWKYWRIAIWSWTEYTVIEFRVYVEVVKDRNLIQDRVHSYWIQSLCGSSEGSEFDPGQSTQLLNSECMWK